MNNDIKRHEKEQLHISKVNIYVVAFFIWYFGGIAAFTIRLDPINAIFVIGWGLAFGFISFTIGRGTADEK